jgi:dTDP-4-dehydrorhamnose 3,5-epimerase-like enzyme
MKATTIDALQNVTFSQYRRDQGVLTVFPCDDPTGVPFPVARMFTIAAVPVGETRGHHAHRACTQLLVCVSGRADVRIEDGGQARTVILDSAGVGLLVPPGLWNVVTFTAPTTVLAVFCDQPFDEADYIRDRAEFLREKTER